ncbi:MAG: helix-turn-helix domain-containing protein [Anaerolineae bacterium]|nr:helix-turn-helix domain-containing protein [Anaerolineae bacterium]
MELSMSQETLAERAQVNQSTISQIERGEQSPSLNSLVSITEALDTSVEWLLGIRDQIVTSWDDQESLDEVEREALEIIRSVDRQYREELVQILKMVVAFRRL